MESSSSLYSACVIAHSAVVVRDKTVRHGSREIVLCCCSPLKKSVWKDGGGNKSNPSTSTSSSSSTIQKELLTNRIHFFSHQPPTLYELFLSLVSLVGTTDWNITYDSTHKWCARWEYKPSPSSIDFIIIRNILLILRLRLYRPLKKRRRRRLFVLWKVSSARGCMVIFNHSAFWRRLERSSVYVVVVAAWW